MKTIYLFIFCALPLFAQAQIDSARLAILNYNDTTAMMIRNGRRLIADKINRKETRGIVPIMEVLAREIRNDPYKRRAFTLQDAHLLGFWANDFKTILADTVFYKLVELPRSEVGSRTNEFTDLLADAVLSQRSRLSTNLNAATISEEERDFLLIYLDELLLGSGTFVGTYTENKTRISIKTDAFRAKYPSFRFLKQIKLPEMVKTKDDVYPSNGLAEPTGFGIDLGGGTAWYTGRLSENFKSNYAMRLGMDLKIKRWIFGLDFSGTYAAMIPDSILVSDVTWRKGDKMASVFAGVTGGYVFIDKKRNHSDVFMGFGSNLINPNLNNKSIRYDRLTDNQGVALSAGVETNFKFFMKKAENTANHEGIFYQLKLRYTYTQPFLVGNLSGGYHAAVATLGFYFGE